MRPLRLPLLVPEATWTPPETLPSLAGATRIAVDVETCDPALAELGPGVRRGAYVAGLAVGIEGGGRWYLPVAHEGGGNLDADLVRRWARRELNAFAGEVVGANLLYDLDFLAEEPWGVTFPRARAFLDVQNAEPLLDEHRFEYNLGALSRDYLGEGKEEAGLKEAGVAWGFPTAQALKSNLWRLPPAVVGPYAEGDVDRPLRLLPLQLQRLAAEDLLGVWQLESDLVPLLLAMRRRGVRVDLERAGRVRADLVKRRDAALAEVRRYAGPRAELMAADSLVRALEDRGLHLDRTPTGKPAIRKPWLEAHRADPLVAALLEGRRLSTIVTTFLDGGIFGHQVRGRIHCTFNQLKGEEKGTIARFSSDSPNLQNLPSKDPELGPMTRAIFTGDEGEDWGRYDESQIEYRLLVHYATGRGAEEARRRYNEDPSTDFHKLCAGFLSVDPENSTLRKKIKGCNFCKVYGGGVKKIAEMLGCPQEEAAAFVQRYDAELPFVKETFDLVMRVASQRGYLTTLTKRRQRFPFWEPASREARSYPSLPRERALLKYGPHLKRAQTYAALNRLLQAGAADYLKRAMVDYWRSGLVAELGAPLVTVHDELGFSVPRTVVGETAFREVKRLMEHAIPLRVPMIANGAEGKNWGETS